MESTQNGTTISWPIRWRRDRSFDSWFAWIEWLGLTSGLWTIAASTDILIASLLLGALAFVSTWLLFHSTLAWLLSVVIPHVPRLGLPAPVAKFLGWIIGFPLVLGLTACLTSVFLAFLK